MSPLSPESIFVEVIWPGPPKPAELLASYKEFKPEKGGSP